MAKFGIETPEGNTFKAAQRAPGIEYSIPEMIPLKEAAVRTGLSYDLLRKLCLTGKIVHLRAGAKYLVNFGKLCEWLNTEGQTNGQ